MDLVVLTAQAKFHTPVTNRLKSKVFVDDCLTLVGRDLEELITKTSIKPFLSKYYLVEVFVKELKAEDYKRLKKLSNCQFIFYCNTIKELEKTTNALDKNNFKYQVLNNYKIPIDIFCEYAKSIIGYQEFSDYQLILSRVRGKFNLCENYLNKLKIHKENNYGVLTRKDIIRIIPNFNKINFNKLWLLLLNPKTRLDKSSISKIYKLYLEYQYSGEFFKETLLSLCNKTIGLACDYEEGKVDLKNLTKYLEINDNFKSQYDLQSYLDIIEVISLEELLYIRNVIYKCTSQNYGILETLLRIQLKQY